VDLVICKKPMSAFLEKTKRLTSDSRMLQAMIMPNKKSWNS
jgi:hypothetical protein